MGWKGERGRGEVECCYGISLFFSFLFITLTESSRFEASRTAKQSYSSILQL